MMTGLLTRCESCASQRGGVNWRNTLCDKLLRLVHGLHLVRQNQLEGLER